MARKIEKEMIDFIDAKLSGNGLAQHAIETKNARLLFVLAAEACVGIKEKSGRNDGRMIQLIQETVGGANGEPYCAAGIMTCLAYAEHKTGISSPVPATELAQDIWRNTPEEYRVKRRPLSGAIGVWADYSGTKRKTTGHCEIVHSSDAASWNGIGFNTSGTTAPGAEVDRDGNGVFYTARDYKPRSNRKLLGFVRPF